MQTIAVTRGEASPKSSVTRMTWVYLALAFGISWLVWLTIIAVAHGREELLHLGTAGPALAAVILSRRGQPDFSYSAIRRLVTFCSWYALCWIVLEFYYSWRANPNLQFGFSPWLLAPAMIPAWVLSGVQSRDLGIRNFLRRLVHAPVRWSLLALLLFPAILLVPAVFAHFLHLPLVTPEQPARLYSLVATDAVFFLYNVLFVAVLEEPGWRGFLLDNLQAKYSPLLASTMVWFAWALWHAPLDYFRPVRFSLSMYLQVRFVFLIPIAIILTWLYNRSNRSIQSTVVFHASMNTFPFVLPYYPPALALLFVLAGYGVISERMWRKRDLVISSQSQLD